MANTSRKRPPPAPTPSTTNNGAPPSGIDQLLTKYARHLPPNGTITIRLIKGPSSSSVDPIAARRNADAAVALDFPRVAKFGESVGRPDFGGRLVGGRMYEEDVPKAKDESDEEESTAYRSTDPDDPTSTQPSRKKKRRWRKNDPRPKRWILQEKSEFLQRVAAQRKKKAGVESGDEDESKKLSNQYHGVAEANASKFAILSVNPQSTTAATNGQAAANTAAESIILQLAHGFHNFSQPYKTAGLSMEEAESAIEQQRNLVTRYMMHGRYANAATDKNEAAAALAAGVAGRGRGGRPLGPPPKAMSRARLLGKLAGNGGGKDEEDEDVMSDLKFESKKGSSRARKELLSSMADDGVTVDDDGVLGGANDAEFGGRRRFARVAVDNSDNGEKKGGKSESTGTATGFEAGAMEEGFYQRDVGAEYEALDYDANEQFDDDDVNLGEDEIQDDGGGGFAGDVIDSDDDVFDSDEFSGEEDDGLAGIASASGLKAMIAKARGDSPTNLSADGAGPDAVPGDESSRINKMLDAAKKTAEELEKKKVDPGANSESTEQDKSAAAQEPKTIGIEKDKDGKRLITMEAIRREIWLNNGAIKSKKLMRIFDVTTKNPERQAVFKSIVMELCTMKKDADGNKLVLKQHYAKSN